MLLFISRDEDLHADWVEAECDRRGTAYFRLCPRQFPQEIQLHLNLNGHNLQGGIRLPSGEIALEDIQGIWYRRPEPPEPHADLDEEFIQFVRQESSETLYGLYRTLWDRRWVNAPHADRLAHNKIYQLGLAHRIGFKTPATIITNDPGEALAFCARCGKQIIYKLMHPLFIEDEAGVPLGVYTTVISQAELEARLESVQSAPCLFQEFIPKQYELRVNVIGKYVWASAIYSQDIDHTKIDYRRDAANCRHAPVLLPPELEALCLKMTHQLGLRMSNIDLILTPAGEYVFLEVNPNGQWGWVEDYTGLPLTRALVDELLGVDTLADHPYLKYRSLKF